MLSGSAKIQGHLNYMSPAALRWAKYLGLIWIHPPYQHTQTVITKGRPISPIHASPAHAVLGLSFQKKKDLNTSLQKGSAFSTYLLKTPSGQDEDAACPVVPPQTNRTL